jgi:hypothetical protein
MIQEVGEPARSPVRRLRIGPRRTALGIVVLAAATLIVVAAPEARETIIRLELAAAGTLLAWLVLGRVPWIAAAAPSTFTTQADAAPQGSPEIGVLRAIDTDLRMATATRFGLETRLKPTLRALTAWRLLRSRGLDLDALSDEAGGRVGPELWAMIDPTRTSGDDRAPGAAVEAIERAVSQLEAI